MKNALVCLMLTACCVLSFAQAPDTAWTKTYGGTENDIGYSVLQTTDGGYLIVGSTESFGAGGLDAYIIRTGPTGDTIWTKCYGGAENDEAFDIKPTLDGHYIIAGYTVSFGQGGADIWLLKIDSLGDTLVTVTYGGPGDDVAYSVAPTADSAFVVTGPVPVGFHYGVYLLKSHLESTPDWMQIYAFLNYSWGLDVLQTNDRGYIIVVDVAEGPLWYTHGLIMKTDDAGDTIWTASPDLPLNDCHIIETAGGYTVGGTTGPNGSNPEIRLVRFDTNGNLLWDKILYANPDHNPFFYDIAQTFDSGYIVVGTDQYVGPRIILIKADADGDTLWHTFYGGADYGNFGCSVLQSADGGFVIIGATTSYGAGGSDVYLIKTEPDVGVEEQPIAKPIATYKGIGATIIRGPLQLPEGKKCKVYDITGRVVEPNSITRGIYFVEIEGKVIQKVIRVR